MLRTPVCDLLDMKVPIMQAAIWPATAPKLVAAVCEAGGLGSIGAVFESAESVQRQIARVREITPRPFAVNHAECHPLPAGFRALGNDHVHAQLGCFAGLAYGVDILPAGEIVERMVSEAELALTRAAEFRSPSGG
jgi:NAD(P)H-dependent flavin oxidoreductase YrpB (nitropropane dioxygenase family)